MFCQLCFPLLLNKGLKDNNSELIDVQYQSPFSALSTYFKLSNQSFWEEDSISYQEFNLNIMFAIH